MGAGAGFEPTTFGL